MQTEMGNIRTYNDVVGWLAEATDKYHIYVNDLERLSKLFLKPPSSNDEITESETDFILDPKVITAVAALKKYKDQDLSVISTLSNDMFLARTFKLGVDQTIHFVVFDVKSLGEAIMEFEWPVWLPHRVGVWSFFAVESKVHFICQPSCCYAYTVLVELPPDLSENGRNVDLYPPVRVLCSEDLHLKDVCITRGPGDPVLWPVQVTCHPRPEQEHLCLMLCCQNSPEVILNTNSAANRANIILLYDLQSEQVLWTKTSDNFVPGVLDFVQDGQSFFCLCHTNGDMHLWHCETHPFYFNKYFELTGLEIPTKNEEDRIDIVWNTSLESACRSWYILVMTFRDKQGKVSAEQIQQRGRVCCVKIPPSKVVASLQTLCVRCILVHVTDAVNNIDKLPLPKSLRDKLKGKSHVTFPKSSCEAYY